MIINILIPIFLLLFIAIFLISYRKRKSIFTDIKWGLKCYRCKEDVKNIVDIVSFDENLTICKSCNREIKIIQLSGGLRPKIESFNKLLISEKIKRYQKYALLIVSIFIIFGVIVNIFFDIKIFMSIGNIFNLFYWMVMVYQNRLLSIKKHSQL